MLEIDTIYNEDCRVYLDRLDDRSVDLFILDPPYMNVVRDEWDKQWRSLDDYLAWCETWIAKVALKAKYSCSLWLFGFPYQLMHLVPILERHGFNYRQQIVIWKGIQSAAGRTSAKLKMFPTTTESVLFFAYDSIPVIKEMLMVKKAQSGLSAKALNELLGKATNGGGTWSQIAGP